MFELTPKNETKLKLSILVVLVWSAIFGLMQEVGILEGPARKHSDWCLVPIILNIYLVWFYEDLKAEYRRMDDPLWPRLRPSFCPNWETQHVA